MSRLISALMHSVLSILSFLTGVLVHRPQPLTEKVTTRCRHCGGSDGARDGMSCHDCPSNPTPGPMTDAERTAEEQWHHAVNCYPRSLDDLTEEKQWESDNHPPPDPEPPRPKPQTLYAIFHNMCWDGNYPLYYLANQAQANTLAKLEAAEYLGLTSVALIPDSLIDYNDHGDVMITTFEHEDGEREAIYVSELEPSNFIRAAAKIQRRLKGNDVAHPSTTAIVPF